MTTNYMQPNPQFPAAPGGAQTFLDFLQNVFTGISGLPGSMVRPSWQQQPPKEPVITDNWLSIGIINDKADANAYVGMLPNGVNPPINVTKRDEELTVRARFYGPQAYEYMGLTRDGFEIPMNLIALTQASMGFVEATEGVRVPDLVGEQWQDTWISNFVLRRQILRAYPILTFLSVSVSLTAQLDSGNFKTVSIDENL